MCDEEQPADVASMTIDALRFEQKIIKAYIRDLNRDKIRRKRQIVDEIRLRQAEVRRKERIAENGQTP